MVSYEHCSTNYLVCSVRIYMKHNAHYPVNRSFDQKEIGVRIPIGLFSCPIFSRYV